MLLAYRHQYIPSGARNERFQEILGRMISSARLQRIGAALAPLAS